MEKSFNEILIDLIKELKFKGTFSKSGNVFYFDTKEKFNDIFNCFITADWSPLRSYYESFEKQGKETVTVREMKYIKHDIIIHVLLTLSKQGISGILRRPKKVYDFELETCIINQPQRRIQTMKYSAEDRVVVNMGSKKKPSYFLAEIVKAKNDKFKVEFDDGDTETVELEAIVGMGINKKYKKEIDPEYLEDYLQEDEEVAPPKSKKKPPVGDDDDEPKRKKVVEEDGPDLGALVTKLSILKKSFKTLIGEVEAIKEACDILIEKMVAGIEVISSTKESSSDKKTKPSEEEEEAPVKDEDDNWLDEE